MIAAANPPQKAPPAPYEPYRLDLADPISLRERVDTGHGHRPFEAIYYTGRNAHQVIALAAGRFAVRQFHAEVLELHHGGERQPELAEPRRWIAMCSSEAGVVWVLTTQELIERFQIVAPDAVPLSAANTGAGTPDAPPPSLNLEGRAIPLMVRNDDQEAWHVGIMRGGTVTGLVAIQVDDFMQLSPCLNAGWCATALAAAMNADDAPRRGMHSRSEGDQVRKAFLMQALGTPPTEPICRPAPKPTQCDPAESPDEPRDDPADAATPDEITASGPSAGEPKSPDAGEPGADLADQEGE